MSAANDKQPSSEPNRRIRRAVNRYGVAESDINDDAMFDDADLSSNMCVETQSQSSSQSEQDEDLSVLSPGQSLIYKKLCKLEVYYKRLDDRLRNVELHTVSSNAKQPIKRLDKASLVEYGLPLKLEQNLNDFESSLSNLDMETKLFNVLKKIGGTEGKSSGENVLIAIFEYLFDIDFLKKISWSGKGANNVRDKIALNEKTNTLALVTKLCLIADEKYTQQKCTNDIIYKAIKYRNINASKQSAPKAKRPRTSKQNSPNNSTAAVSLEMHSENGSDTLQKSVPQQSTHNHATGKKDYGLRPQYSLPPGPMMYHTPAPISMPPQPIMNEPYYPQHGNPYYQPLYQYPQSEPTYQELK